MLRIGGLWKHKNKEGQTILTGKGEFIPGLESEFVIFPVKAKKSDKSPDYDLCVRKLGDKKDYKPKKETTYEDVL